jgi:hypothetical protein
MITAREQDADDADRYRFLTMFNADGKKMAQLMPHIEPWYEQWESRGAHKAGDPDATHAFVDKLRDTAIGLKLWWPI